MSLKNKSVLVTGGAGFIGSYLVDRIITDEPDNLVAVDNFFIGKESNLNDAKQNYPNLKVYNQDATDLTEMAKILENENVDVVFNLAVIPLPACLTKPKWVFEQNIDLALTMCELGRKDLYKTLIHYSSSETYGTSEYAPMDEKHPLNGRTPYAASKAASDVLIFSYYHTFGLDTSIIRPFNNYGPRQNEGTYAGVIPLTVKRILSGEGPVIYGDGEQTRDYLYVTDTVNATIDVYNNNQTRAKVLNIASGQEVTINTVVKNIAKQMNWDKPIVYEDDRPGDVRRHIANIFLAEELIGFKPQVNFIDGLKMTVDWYLDNIDIKNKG